MSYAALSTIQTIATGQVFTAATLQQANDNDEFLIDPPSCSVYHSTTQALTSGNISYLAADSENYDNDSMHSTSTNNSRITIQTAGRYLFVATLRFAANTDTTDRLVQFRVDGSTAYNANQQDAPDEASRDSIITGVRSLVMSAGQYVECGARAGANINVTLEEFVALFQTR